MTIHQAENELLNLVRRSLHGQSPDESPIQSIDPRNLMKLASSHGVLPLVSLNKLRLDEDDSTLLQRESAAAARSNIFLASELTRLTTLLDQHDISVISFKGPTLALTAYGDIGARQFIDLDVLVRGKDTSRVFDLLKSHGWHSEFDLTRARERALLKFDCALTFENERGVIVDVHWDFAERYLSLAVDSDLWDRTERIIIGNREVSVLSLEDLLIVLCLHAFTHSWGRLAWICDIAALLIRHPNVDWRVITERAARTGVGKVVSVGTLLASDMFDAPLPAEVKARMRQDKHVVRALEEARAKVFAGTATVGLVGEIRSMVNLRNRMLDKFRMLTGLVFTPRRYDWMWMRAPLPFLCYPIRLARIATRLIETRLRSNKSGEAFPETVSTASH